eukprot:TRINITY_DN596_c2_g1_i1.p1 TRINITY_DN596_c2_g1~~TRINITY_DN596_c2_g1_i1.p1  ORF type:complete len:460 (+),score=130.61 TRINITY_DN596_c2_g1_i1:54-1433(+)
MPGKPADPASPGSSAPESGVSASASTGTGSPTAPPPPVKVKPKFRPPKVIVRKQPPPPAATAGMPHITQSGAFVLREDDGLGIRIDQAGTRHTDPLASSFTARQNSDCMTPGSDSSSAIRFENLSCIKELGRGVSGTVTLQEDSSTGKRYAVKTMHVGMDPQAMKSVLAEVKRVFGDPCEYIVSTLQSFHFAPQLHVVQEFMDAGALDALVERCKVEAIFVPEAVAGKIAEQLLRGLRYLHQKKPVDSSGRRRSQVHRDLKPANILLNREGYCKIADFGIASDLATMGQKTVVGTTTYMAPERITAQPYGLPSDVWAVGVIVDEILLGAYPFKMQGGYMCLLQDITGGQPALPSDRSPQTVEFIEALLRKKPDERPTAEAALQYTFVQEPREPAHSVVAKWLREIEPKRDGAEAGGSGNCAPAAAAAAPGQQQQPAGADPAPPRAAALVLTSERVRTGE